MLAAPCDLLVKAIADDTLFLSTLSVNDIRITGLLLTPYKVCVEVKFEELIVCVITSKLDETGGGVGGGCEDEGDFLH
jgi:hypothetical protein